MCYQSGRRKLDTSQGRAEDKQTLLPWSSAEAPRVRFSSVTRYLAEHQVHSRPQLRQPRKSILQGWLQVRT